MGGVDYTYRISKHEVTAGQYTEFLNAVATSDYNRYYHWDMWEREDGCKIKPSGPIGNQTFSVPDDRANRPVNE